MSSPLGKTIREQSYSEIKHMAWCQLIEKYGVDEVMTNKDKYAKIAHVLIDSYCGIA